MVLLHLLCPCACRMLIKYQLIAFMVFYVKPAAVFPISHNHISHMHKKVTSLSLILLLIACTITARLYAAPFTPPRINNLDGDAVTYPIGSSPFLLDAGLNAAVTAGTAPGQLLKARRLRECADHDTDPEGNALTASLVTAPVNGTIVLNAERSAA